MSWAVTPAPSSHRATLSARWSSSSQVRTWSPWTSAGASPSWSATVSHTSAKFHVLTSVSSFPCSPGPRPCVGPGRPAVPSVPPSPGGGGPRDDHDDRCSLRWPPWTPCCRPTTTPAGQSSGTGSPTTRADGAGAGRARPGGTALARPVGAGADPTYQLLVDEELRRAGVRRPENTIGIGWAGPTLLHAGTVEQKARYLLPLLAADEIWCQLFSEPGAGSDLASLSTRAELDGDEWVVQGQKVWTSYAHQADFGILLARTEPDAPTPPGDLLLRVPDGRPGVAVRPLVDMTGGPLQRGLPRRGPPAAGQPGGRAGSGLVAGEGDVGQRAGVTVRCRGAVGMGPTVDALVDAARAAGGITDPLLRQRLVAVWTEGEILRLLRLRTVSAAVTGAPPGPRPRCARRWPTSTGSTSWSWPVTWPAPWACCPAAARSPGRPTPVGGRTPSGRSGSCSPRH